MSFALLVYASAHLKRYHPAAFCAALLRAQPMGFYSPQSLVADARRHGVTTRGPDINASLAHPTLEPDPASTGGHAIRLGLAAIRGLSDTSPEAIVTTRDADGPFTSIGDLGRRAMLTQPQLESLATAGVFEDLGEDRRQALWSAGAVARDRPGHLPGVAVGLDAPALPGMTALEIATADALSTGITPGVHPVQFLRSHLTQLGAHPVAALTDVRAGTRVPVGGAITHRQRPATAGGITLLNLEDETGMLNIICSVGLFLRTKRTVRMSSALLIRGVVERGDGGVVSLLADRLEPLDLRVVHASCDFR